MEFSAKIVVKLNPKWRQVEEMLEKAIRIAAFTIERTSKVDCPYDTGATRNSITAREAGKLAWTIGPSTHYAPHLEFGTERMTARPFMIPNAEKERPRFTKAVQDITREL
jgi:HK97 gp10 family phage protein